MIRLFKADDRDFSTLGDMIIQPTKATVKKHDITAGSGEWYLDLECGLQYADALAGGRLLVVDIFDDAQPFRIRKFEKTKTACKVRAEHVYFDSDSLVIADTNIVNKTVTQALQQLNANTLTTSPFTIVSSVVGVQKNYRCVRTSLKEAIDTVLERWGGHIVPDKWIIKYPAHIGTDNGVTVRYGKNITDITVTDDWSEVCTKILPVGKDGILLNAVDPSAAIYMTASVGYAIPYDRTVSFDQTIEEEDYPTEAAYKAALVADLREQAQNYLDTHKVPAVNYTIKAYVDFSADIGDTIHVQDERLGVSMTTRVIGYTYDAILSRISEIEFGNTQKKTLGGLQQSIIAAAVQNMEGLINGSH